MRLPSRKAQAAIACVLAVAAFVFWWLSRPDPLPASAIPAHTPDLANGRVDLFVSRRGANGYEAGERVDAPVNHPSYNSYGPMIDWSNPHRLLFSARRSEAKGMDVYVIEYKLDRVLQKQ